MAENQKPENELAAAPEGMVNVFVDGEHTIAPKDSNLIQAAKLVGNEIPYFCWHPKLSVAGECRICLVETSDAPGRLVPGCHIKVKEGLNIITDTPGVADNRRAVMEFHLLNHPVDCAICDQSGECKLQDYYMDHDAQPSRIATTKVAKPKRKIFGPLVVYDAERCILCTRCVRFMNEVAQEPQLAMVGRGDHSEIDVMPGQQLDSKYSGNTVDVCPVGALLNRDFRFTSRVWYLEGHRTVCGGCANGCNASADTRADQMYRLLPKRNEEVNEVWLCDDGRTSYHRAMDGRVEHPRAGREESGEYPTIEAAQDLARDALKALAGRDELAVALSATCSTEELFAAATFAKEVLGAKKIYRAGRPNGEGDDFLIRENKNPNDHGLTLAAEAAGVTVSPFVELVEGVEKGKLRSLVMFGAEVPTDEEKTAQTFAKLETFVAFAVSRSAVTDQATLLLPLSTHFEQRGTFVNWYGRLQRFEQTVEVLVQSLPAYVWVSRLAAAIGQAWTFESADDAFALLAGKHPKFKGLKLSELPLTGVVLEGFEPTDWPARAPRPAQAKSDGSTQVT